MPAAPRSPQFKQHPISLGGISVLDGNLARVKSASDAADALLVAAPSPNVPDANGGSIMRALLQTNEVRCRVTNVEGLLAADTLALIYKNAAGKEVQLDSVSSGAGFAQGEIARLSYNAQLLMAPGDGLYVRVATALQPSPGRVDITSEYYDVRGVLRAAADVDSVQVIAAAGGNPDLATLIYENNTDLDVQFSGFLSFGLVILNWDVDIHTYQLFLTNGDETFVLTDTDGNIPEVENGSYISVRVPPIPPGWSLKASLGEAVNEVAPTFVFGPSTTNLDIARTDQGGAY